MTVALHAVVTDLAGFALCQEYRRRHCVAISSRQLQPLLVACSPWFKYVGNHLSRSGISRIHFYLRPNVTCVLHYLTYSRIASPLDAHKKSNCQQTERATTNRRPRMENSWRGESISAWYIFMQSILTSFFKTTFHIPSKQKHTKQNRIRLVKFSCAKVSGPSEVCVCV